MNRDNHYEAAFEAYLAPRAVGVHRGRRSAAEPRARRLAQESRLHRLAARAAPSWLVDVKGRRFPSGDEHQQYWKNWSTRDDLRSLAAWQRHFGDGFLPLLVFAYHLVGRRSPLAARAAFRVSRRALRLRRRCGWPISCPTPGRSPTAGIRWRCRSASSAARPGSLDELLHAPLPAAGRTFPAMTATDWHPLPAGLE